MSYHNDILQGTILDLYVSMEVATEPQIADVATKINELRGHQHQRFSPADTTIAARSRNASTRVRR
jgi:hypothetical protein